jgi:hypothetical protein
MTPIPRAMQKAARRIFGRRHARIHRWTLIRLVPPRSVEPTRLAAFYPPPMPVSYVPPITLRHHGLDVPKVTGSKGITWHRTGRNPPNGSADTAKLPHARVAAGNAPKSYGSARRRCASAFADC